MTPRTPSTASYHRHPSPEPSIFFFEADPASPPATSQQTLSTDTSTLYVPFYSYTDKDYLKNYSKMSSIDPPRRPPGILPPPPHRILSPACQPSSMVCVLSAPRFHSEEALDSAASKRRLSVQLERTAVLLAKSIKQSAILADEDAFEVEVVDQYPRDPLLTKKPRPLWAWCLRKVVRKCRDVGRVVFCLE